MSSQFQQIFLSLIFFSPSTWTPADSVCNPEDNSCSYVACMSSKRGWPGVIAHEGRIYAFGGTNAESGQLSTAEVYIPEEDRWEDIPSMSVEREYPVWEFGEESSPLTAPAAAPSLGSSSSWPLEDAGGVLPHSWDLLETCPGP